MEKEKSLEEIISRDKNTGDEGTPTGKNSSKKKWKGGGDDGPKAPKKNHNDMKQVVPRINK